MKRTLLVACILGLISAGRVHAQQDPQFTQYMFNQLFYNPAYAGIEGAAQFNLLYRAQWAGYQSTFDGGGAPTTSTINFNTPIYKLQSGFGAEIVNDNLGPSNSLSLRASYAYHLNVKESKLSIGLNFGFISKSINFDEYRWADPDDPYRLEGKETQAQPDMGVGVYYRNKKFYAGVSVDHLLQSQFNFGIDDLRNALEPNFYLIGGYDYAVSYNLVITPSVLVKSDFNTYTFDLSALVTYNEKMWGGVSFRQSEAVIMMLGYSMFKDNSLKFGYAFDYVIQNQEAKQATSHELLLSYVLPVSPFGSRKIIRTPRFRH